MRATIDTIHDVGYYRASSNEIARRAGFTWGAIQHHFGTREALILAVLEWIIDEVIGRFTATDISGDTLGDRLGQLWDMFMSFYANPEYIAILQLLLDLAHDPTHGAGTKRAVRRYTQRFNKQRARLTVQVWQDEPVQPEEIELFFSMMWGIGVEANTADMFAPKSSPKGKATLRAAKRWMIAMFTGPKPS